MLTRDQIAVLRRVLAAASGEAPVPATDPDLTIANLVVDDLEAAVDAYEVWIGREAEIGEFALAEDAGIELPW